MAAHDWPSPHSSPAAAAPTARLLPSDPATSKQIILRHLAQRDECLHLKILAKLLAGLFASCLIPALLALAIAFQARADSFWEVFRFACVFLVVLGFVLAWRWSDDDLLEQVRYLGQMYGPLDSGSSFTQTTWDWDMKRGGGELVFTAGFLILGPRTIVSSMQQWLARRKLHNVSLSRAVDVVVVLLGVDHGLPLAGLRHPHEDGQTLATSLAFLRLHDWIDVGMKTQHIWLRTPARDLLIKDLTAPRLAMR